MSDDAPRTVLLVDDDATLLDVLATLLDLEGFRVHTASDGESALSMVERERPDVVVCDVSMPGIDGLEVCRRLKADAPGRPVVLLTAHGGPRAQAAGEAAGCDAYLTKPFSPLELLDLLGELGTSRAGDEA